MIRRVWSVTGYFLTNYRRTWRGSVFSAFLLPVMFLIAMGKGVGAYVDVKSGSGMPYFAYLAPGVLASTALQIGIFESAFPVYTAFNWYRTYFAMHAAPLRPADIMLGHLSFVQLRVAMSAAGFMVAMVLFGAVRSPWFLLALPASLLVGLAAAAPVFAYSAIISSENLYSPVFRLIMAPMTLFAGVFFPVAALPVGVRVLAYLSPLWHGVELCRAAALGVSTAWGVPAHVACLLVWSGCGYLWARRAYTRRLTGELGSR